MKARKGVGVETLAKGEGGAGRENLKDGHKTERNTNNNAGCLGRRPPL